MNHTRILNISDENSILITAEFYEDGHRLRTERNRTHRYELDLIVPDDITLEQLLEAVWEGICTQLDKRYRIDPGHLDANPAYHGTILRFEQMQRRYEQFPREFFRVRRLRKPLHYRHHAAKAAAERFNAGKPEEGPLPGEEDLWRWLVCMDVCRRCLEQYRHGYPEYLEDAARRVFRPKVHPRHPVIACGNITSRNWSDEGVRSLGRHIQIWLRRDLHGGRTLRELGFFSSSRLIFDPNSHHTATPWFDALELQPPADSRFPMFVPAGRSNVQIVSHQVRIDDPGTLLGSQLRSVFPALGALLAAALTFLPVVLLSPYASLIPEKARFPLLYCVGLAALVLGGLAYRCGRILLQRYWYRHYETYIRDLLQQLKTMQDEDTKHLTERYPPVYDIRDADDLVERAFCMDGSISARRADQSDFLHVRIGTSREGSRTAPAPVEFKLPDRRGVFSTVRYKNIRNLRGLPFRLIPTDKKEDATVPNDGTCGFFNDLAEDIRDTYAWLDHAPVLMDLRHARAMGVWFQDPECSFYPLLNNMIFDLCYHHSPDDLQFVMFAPNISGLRKQQAFVRQFKQLPHFNQLLPDQSQFVFDPLYAERVMDRLFHLHSLRGGAPRRAPGCHVIVLVLESYGLWQHRLASLLPASAGEREMQDNDLTFLFFTHSESSLPPYCSHVLKRNRDHSLCYVPYSQKFDPALSSDDGGREGSYEILPDDYAACFRAPGTACEHDRMYQAFKILSALRHAGAARTALPRQIGMDRLLELSHPELPAKGWFHAPSGSTSADWKPLLQERLREFTEKQWSDSDQSTELAVPIGVDSHGPLWLELDRLHNVLIASDPGAGKTETLITIMTSLCLHHSPRSVQLLLVDPGRGGIREALDAQPHTVLKLSGTVSGGLPAAMQKLFGNLQAEVRRRSAAFSQMGVGSIREYNAALLDLDRHIRTRLKLDPVRDEALVGQLRALKRMPQLILAMDHMDEIMQLLRNDGMEQEALQHLQWLFPLSDTHGIHVLLAAEQPQRILPQEIWPWLQGRLCLRTEDPQLSERLLRSQAASAPSMPGGGRAWLYDAPTGEAAYGQIALTRQPDDAGAGGSFRVTLMEQGSTYLPFYDSDGPVSGSRRARGWRPFEEDPQASEPNGSKRSRKRYTPRNDRKKASTGGGTSSGQQQKPSGEAQDGRDHIPNDRTRTTAGSPGEIPNDRTRTTAGSPVEVPNDIPREPWN